MAKLYEVAEPLPPHVRRATEQEVAWVRANAATLIERVDVPSDRYPKR